MRALTAVLALATACATRPAPRHADHPAVHGMLLFGERTTYLSHLPLFHPPHDYQVVFAADLSPEARTHYRADRMAHAATIYTVVPERFRLPELIEGNRHFRAEVVRGHFERGGAAIDRDVAVAPTRMITARRLPAGRVAGREYLLFGARDEAYLVHLVAAPPDFDQVLRVAPPAAVSDEALARGVTVAAGVAGQPLAAAGEVTVELEGRPAALVVREQVYLEWGDLKD